MIRRSDQIEIIEYALSKTIKESAEKFGVSTKSVSRWLKRYQTLGYDNYLSVNKRERRSDALNKKSIKDILEFKRKNPKATARKIIEKLRLECSSSTVYRVLREAGYIFREREKDILIEQYFSNHYSQPPFTSLYYRVSKIEGNQPTIEDSRTIYIYEVIDLATKSRYLGVSKELSSHSISIFISYILSYIPPSSNNLNIITDRNQLFNRNKLFIKVIEKRSSHTAIDRVNSKVRDLFPPIVGKDFQYIEDQSIFDLAIIQQHNNLISKHHLSSDSIFRFERVSNRISPLIIDRYLPDTEKIVTKNNYWRDIENIRDNIFFKGLETLNNRGKYYQENFRYDKAVEIFDKILNLLDNPSKVEDIELKIEAYINRGRVGYRFGKKCSAEEDFKKAITLSYEVENQSFKIKSRLQLAEFYFQNGNYNKGRVELNLAKDIADKSDQTELKLNVLNYFGKLSFREGNFHDSIKYFNKIMSHFNDSCVNHLLIKTLHKLTISYQKVGDISSGKSTIKRGLDLSIKIGDKQLIGRSYQLYGALYFLIYYLDKAESYLNRGLNHFKDIDDIKGIADCYAQLGHIKSVKNRFDDSLTLYKKSERLFLKIVDYEGVIKTKINIAIIYDKQGRFQDAINYTKTFYKYAAESDRKDFLISYHGNLGIYYMNLKRYSLAENSLKKAIQLSRKLKNRERLCANLYVLANVKNLLNNIYSAKKYVDEAYSIAFTLYHQAYIFSINILRATINWKIELRRCEKRVNYTPDLRAITTIINQLNSLKEGGVDSCNHDSKIKIGELNTIVWELLNQYSKLCSLKNISEPITPYKYSLNPENYRVEALSIFNELSTYPQFDFREEVERLERGE